MNTTLGHALRRTPPHLILLLAVVGPTFTSPAGTGAPVTDGSFRLLRSEAPPGSAETSENLTA